MIGVFRKDGVLLVRYPRREDATGNVYPNSSATLFAAQGESSGTMRLVSPVDGRDRFVSVQSLDNYPLMLIVGRTSATRRGQARAVELAPSA